MDGWQYLVVLGVCVVVTVPLEFVLGARVYRRPRLLVATLAPVVVAFGAWDLFGYHRGDWWYSIRQTLGARLLGLPVEEWLFFLVVPVCALLTFEALGSRGGGRDR
ncbi:lycopene cyclase domain-containing protein [Actinocatenispora comari]|jgi:lycopene cyclase domain-containing protein|nr:lycopene cyclase domain-containing protein [Actinocatenispora comari]